MATWVVRKVTVELAEIEAPSREEARRLADEDGYGTFNLSEVRFTAHRPAPSPRTGQASGGTET